MKVYDVNLTGAAAGESGRAQETQRTDNQSGARTAAGRSASDRVELSGALESISRAVSSYGAGRAAKVQALSRQYQSGSYQPDSLRTSRGMISEALSSGTR